MRKKGFTLMEMLVVLVIAGIIMLIAVPSMMTISKSAKSRELSAKREALLSAAEAYGKDNIPEFGDDNVLSIPVRILLYHGYIEKDSECDEVIGCIINPITNESMNDEIIYIKRNFSIIDAKWDVIK